MSAKYYSGQIFSKNIPLYYNLIQLVVQGWHSIFTAILNKKKSPAFSLKDNSVKYSSKTTTINKAQSLLYQDDFRYIQWRYLNFLTIPFSNLLANIITHIKFLFLSFYALFCKLTIP